MNKTVIRVEDTEYPVILVDGTPYNIFCEIETKEKTFQSLYIREGGTEVFVKTGPETAIVGLFSIEESHLRPLFDYLEATINKQDGLICHEAEDFPRLLTQAAKLGGKYPILQDNLRTAPLKSNGLTNFLRQLRPRRPLDTELQKQLSEHTVSIDCGIRETIDRAAFSDSNREEEAKASLSEQLQSASQRRENAHQNHPLSHSQDNQERSE